MSEFQRLLQRRPYRRSRSSLRAKLVLPLLLAGGVFAAVSGPNHSTKRVAVTGPLAAGQRSAGAAPGRQLIDRLTRVRDGDTIAVGLIPTRIANLDCAEAGTRAGGRAMRHMRELVRGQTLTCRLEWRRSYDREVGVCDVRGVDIGEAMISGRYCKQWRWR